MTGSLLGVSVLEMRTDQMPLDEGLALARRKVDATGTAMQASWDRRMVSMGSSMRASATSSTGSLAAMSTAGTRLRKTMDDNAVAERVYQHEVTKGSAARRRATAETRSLSTETGVSARAMRDLYTQMGPVGTAMGDLTTRTRLYRDHGIDYLAAGVVGLEAGLVAMSAKAAVSFADLGDTVARETGLSGKALANFMEVIRTSARDSPYQLSQIADAAVILRREFHLTDHQIGHTSDLMIAFSKAAGQDVRPEMQQLSRIMHDYRAPLGDVVGLTDKLVSISQATQQPLSVVVNTLDRFGPRLQSLGLNLNQSVRLLGIFAASGIPVEQMGRGLASALTQAGKATASNAKIVAGGATKLDQYRIAVQSAQERVNKLTAEVKGGAQAQGTSNLRMQEYELAVQSAKDRVAALRSEIATTPAAQQKVNSELEIAQQRLSIAQQRLTDYGKSAHTAGTSQASLDSELQIAQERLDLAQQKYSSFAKVLQQAKHGHQDVTAAITGEIKQIVNANSKQDALNLAVEYFGKSLGPSMARAFYQNQKALQAVDKAMHHAGATQHLFNVDAKSIPGEIQRAKNNFQDLEIAVGDHLVPALSQGVDWLRRTVKGIDDFYRQHQKLATIAGEIAGISGGLTLLSRHSPLGKVLGKVLADAGHTGLASFFSGKAGAGMWGTHGPTAAGSDANPVAVHVTNWRGGGNGPGNPAKAAGEGAAAAETSSTVSDLSAARRLGLKVGGGAALGIAALSSMSHAQSGVLNQLNAAAHGVDPTSVLHLVGLPAVSDLLPTVKKRMNLTSQDIAMLGSGWTPDQVAEYERLRKLRASATQLPRRVSAGAIGSKPSAGPSQMQNDFGSALAQLQKLGLGKQGVLDTAKALDMLAQQAQKAGDVRWNFADALGAELLRSKNVASKGTTWLISELNKLAPAARTDAAQSMMQMTQMLETDGRLPVGATARLVSEMLSSYKSVHDKGGQYFQGLQTTAGRSLEVLRQKAATSTGKTRQQALTEIHRLQAGEAKAFSQMEGDVARKQAAMTRAISRGTAGAADAAGTNLTNYVGQVQTAMQNGLIVANEGAQLIAKSLNATLKAFGAGKIPTPDAVQWANWALGKAPASSYNQGRGHAGGTGRNTGRFAGGGLYQIGSLGEAGRDTIPLNVGGARIIVGRGETVAVFNRHQRPEIDAALTARGYAGLGGLFNRIRRPNYMAGGGILNGPATPGIGRAHVAGGGTIGRLVQGGLDLLTAVAAGITGLGKRHAHGGEVLRNTPYIDDLTNPLVRAAMYGPILPHAHAHHHHHGAHQTLRARRAQIRSELSSLMPDIRQQRGEERGVARIEGGLLGSASLGSLPPFGSSTADVPLGISAAQTIIGGGRPSSQSAHHFTLVVEDGAVDSRKIKLIADGRIEEWDRKTGRRGGRPLPGRGGGRQIGPAR